MGLIRNYATTMYNWLSKFATTYRTPVLSSMFDSENPKPSEYIEYSADASNFAEQFIQSITIYSQSTAYNYVMDISDKIEQELGESGIVLREDWGYVRIEKGNPFYQDKPDDDDNIHAGYLNFEITIYQYNVKGD